MRYRRTWCAAIVVLLLAGCGGGSGAATEPTVTRPEIPRGGDNIQP